MALRPLQFPELPAPPPGSTTEWSYDVRQASQQICDVYDRASRLLRQEDHNPLQLQILAEKILNQCVRLLEAVDLEVLNPDWAEQGARALATTVVELERAAESTNTNP